MATGTQRRGKSAGNAGKDRKVLIREYAYRLVSRFIYSEKALYRKIDERFSGSEADVCAVIEELKRGGFVDDEKNSRYFAELLRDRGYGPKYIKTNLTRKGFCPPDILSRDGNPESMERWFLKKTGGRKALNKKEWAKVFAYLKSKGFYTEDILDFLRKRGLYERE